MNVSLRLAAVVLLGVATAGCISSFRGTPARPFSQAYAKQSAEVPMDALLIVTEASDRNIYIRGVMAVIDINYQSFKYSVAANKRHSASVADGLTLLMTIAGTLTGSAGVKQNYLQGIALITGATSIYDKNYLQAQTTSALIAQMETNRARVREIIAEGMSKEINEYPAITAAQNLAEYFDAGTILGALLGIQNDAKESEMRRETSAQNLLKDAK